MKFLRGALGSTLVVTSSILFLFGCASKLDVEEIPTSANPSEQISLLESEINEARTAQVDVLSPTWFQRSEKSLKSAKDDLADGDQVKDILHSVATGKAEIKRAKTYAQMHRDTLKPAIAAREDALQLGAAKRENEFKVAENNFMDLGELIESDNLDAAQTEQQAVIAQYNEASVLATQDRLLDGARNNLQQAKENKASKFAPKALRQTEASIKATEDAIKANVHNENENRVLAKNTDRIAAHLVAITAESRRYADAHPEEMAESFEAKTSQLALENRKIEALEDDKSFNQKFSAVRAMFNEDEAEVFREGNRLLIRAKAVQFPSGSANLKPATYPMLSKLRDALQQFPDANVVVEGHTDSTGTKAINEKLSQQRAEAVREYMVSNFDVAPEKVSAEGFGFEKPITDNRTAESRATNRRIDIVIEPTTVTAE